MDVLKTAQWMDALFGVCFLTAAAWFALDGSFTWAGAMLLSSVVSFASVKLQPAKWVLRRMLLARVK